MDGITVEQADTGEYLILAWPRNPVHGIKVYKTWQEAVAELEDLLAIPTLARVASEHWMSPPRTILGMVVPFR